MARIAAFAQQLARIVTPFSRVGQRYFWIGTNNKKLLFLLKSKFEAEGLVPFLRNMQEQSVTISFLIRLVLCSRGFDSFVRQHLYTPILVRPYPQYTPSVLWLRLDYKG